MDDMKDVGLGNAIESEIGPLGDIMALTLHCIWMKLGMAEYCVL